MTHDPLELTCETCGARFVVAVTTYGPFTRAALVENFRRIHAHVHEPKREEAKTP